MGNARLTRMRRALVLLLCLAPLPAAILEQLSLDDLILKSTEIVRAKAVSSSADFRGSMIYTQWNLQVVERWKGTGQAMVEVLVPGGNARGFHQDVTGAPKLSSGKEYVLFLWRSKSGAVYITGLSQGIFDLSKDSRGLVASRPAIGETMLDHVTWRPVKDDGFEMRYSDLAAQISATLAKGGGH
jgi:hypothetical protein